MAPSETTRPDRASIGVKPCQSENETAKGAPWTATAAGAISVDETSVGTRPKATPIRASSNGPVVIPGVSP